MTDDLGRTDGAGLDEGAGGIGVPLTPPTDSALVAHDLGGEEPGPPRLPEILHLFYAAAVNLLAGDPGGGKTFLVLAAVAEVLARGGVAVIIDLEDGPRTIAERLRGLGISRDCLSGSVVYLRSFGAVGASDVDWLRRLVAQYEDVIVIVDSLSEALAMADLDEDRAPDVTRWFQSVARPIADAGAGVLIIDHLAKAAPSGGRWPRGSGHKLAAVDGLAAVLDPIEPFSRERSGSAQVVVAKDRVGAVGGRNELAATVLFDVAGGGVHTVRVIRSAETSHGEAAQGPSIIARRDVEAGW